MSGFLVWLGQALLGAVPVVVGYMAGRWQERRRCMARLDGVLDRMVAGNPEGKGNE